MNTLYLECNMGAAGDMLMAALYELLPDREGFVRTMNSLGLPGVAINPLAARSQGLAGTRMSVTVHGLHEDEPCHHHHTHGQHDCGHHDHGHGHREHDHSHGHEHTALGDVRALIAGLPLPEAVKEHAQAVYGRIAQAEARAHGQPVELVHFHEVGALDAVADVVGVCYAIHLLAPQRIAVSPIHVGSGQVRCAHGLVPVPAPATAQLLSGLPIYGGAIQGELCTPTGAALLAHFGDVFGPMPPMIPERVGIGLGQREFPAANCLRAFWGAQADEAAGRIAQLTCNLDDMTPEELSYACQQLLELGALDVYTLPGTMKKGRPGWQLTLLCAPEREAEFARYIFTHTSTNGLRAQRCEKYYLPPQTEQTDTPYGPVRIKSAGGHTKPEYEDVARLAGELGLPFRQVWQAALCAWKRP